MAPPCFRFPISTQAVGCRVNSCLVADSTRLGFRQLPQDSYFFMAVRKNDIMLIVIYVDDMLITSASEGWIHLLKSSLGRVYI